MAPEVTSTGRVTTMIDVFGRCEIATDGKMGPPAFAKNVEVAVEKTMEPTENFESTKMSGVVLVKHVCEKPSADMANDDTRRYSNTERMNKHVAARKVCPGRRKTGLRWFWTCGHVDRCRAPKEGQGRRSRF